MVLLEDVPHPPHVREAVDVAADVRSPNCQRNARRIEEARGCLCSWVHRAEELDGYWFSRAETLDEITLDVNSFARDEGLEPAGF